MYVFVLSKILHVCEYVYIYIYVRMHVRMYVLTCTYKCTYAAHVHVRVCYLCQVAMVVALHLVIKHFAFL
jgi:hypothetical protein